MTTIITTAGISLHINTKRHIEEITGKKLDPGDDEMQAYLREAAEKASAEANSLLKMIQPGDRLIFLVTKAPLAQRCIRLLEDFFKGKGFQDVSVIHLQFQDNAEQIEKRGIRNLISNLMAAIIDSRQHGPVIINATAGLKAQVVYSTMLGMLLQVPVKYMYEGFQHLVTFNPIALSWDMSVFLDNADFFLWIEDDFRTYYEIEKRLSGYKEDIKGSLLAFIEPPDKDGYGLLSPMAYALFQQARQYKEQAQEEPPPPASTKTGIDEKIAESILEMKHHYLSDLPDVCRKIASLPFVDFIYSEHFERTNRSRMGTFEENGTVRVIWARADEANRLIVRTTASTFQQTIKVRDSIAELLELQ
jgi:putative CRISPR-associated protein (TIGR02619 family)